MFYYNNRSMDNIIRTALMVTCCVGFALTGCFSMDHARFVRSDEEHLLVSNYGWYLFHYFPLACGNASKERWLPWTMFRNDVTMDKIQGRFMDYANSQTNLVRGANGQLTPVVGRRARDLAYTTHESVMLQIPGINLPLPIPYLLTYREIQLSGVLEAPVVPAGSEAVR